MSPQVPAHLELFVTIAALPEVHVAVSGQVSDHAAPAPELLVTQTAEVGLHGRVHQHVALQVGTREERPTADVTLEVALSCMHEKMLLEVHFELEALATQVAGEGAVVGVSTLVVAVDGQLGDEGVSALPAGEGPLPGVRAAVVTQGAVVRELLGAVAALVLLLARVGGHVARQVLLHRERLRTQRALVRLLARMNAEVFLEDRRLEEAFVTHRTHVVQLAIVLLGVILQRARVFERLWTQSAMIWSLVGMSHAMLA